MKQNILKAARIIRSKNSGPYELTLDILFKNRGCFDYFRDNNIISPDLIAGLYKVDTADIMDIIYFGPSNAVKVTLRRRIVSGSPGDTDVYGAQQHAPLLNIEFDGPVFE